MKYYFLLALAGIFLTSGCTLETCYEEKGLFTLEEFFERPENQNINPETDASGLQFVINNPGGAARPSVNADIRVAYEGRHVTGEVFDGRPVDNPLNFNLSRLIRAWQIGIPKIGAGGSITLYVPSELGYGSQGAGADICPNSDLIFDIELISFSQ